MTRKWSATLGLLLFVRVLFSQDLDSPIAKQSKVNYAELLRLVCPDLKVANEYSATATKAVAIRDLDQTTEPQPQEDAMLKLESVSTVAYSKTRALLTFIMAAGLDSPQRVLAVFDLNGPPKLVDIVIVPAFPDDPGTLSRILKLDDVTDAYVFEAYHFNSQQGYDGYSILFLRGDRVEQIEGIGLLSCRGCASGSFDESVELSTALDPGRVYSKVVIRVTFKQLAENHHRPFTRYYTAAYRWDAQTRRFATVSKELEELKAFNHNNY